MPDNTMRVAMYYRNDDVRVEEQAIPAIGPGELLVRIEVCGLCGGETMEWYLAERAPKVLGHEPTGTVEAIGKGVSKFKVGDRVFVHHHVACMSCHYCDRGRYTLMHDSTPCYYRMKSALRRGQLSSRWLAA
jgi:L-iditol 2-dehydrogenase